MRETVYSVMRSAARGSAPGGAGGTTPGTTGTGGRPAGTPGGATAGTAAGGPAAPPVGSLPAFGPPTPAGATGVGPPMFAPDAPGRLGTPLPHADARRSSAESGRERIIAPIV